MVALTQWEEWRGSYFTPITVNGMPATMGASSYGREADQNGKHVVYSMWVEGVLSDRDFISVSCVPDSENPLVIERGREKATWLLDNRKLVENTDGTTMPLEVRAGLLKLLDYLALEKS